MKMYPEKTEKRLYDTVRWRKVAKRQLSRFPLCASCMIAGRDTPATIVHHVIPHENDSSLFWDESNFESVCASCHSGIKRVAEHHGYSQACGPDGFPLDPNHPFNAKKESNYEQGSSNSHQEENGEPRKA